MKRTLRGLLLVAGAALAPACSCSDDGASSGTAGGGGAAGTASGAPNGTGTDSGSGGNSSGSLVTVTSSGSGGQGGAGSGGATSGGGGEGGSCADVTINFEPIVPTVLLLIDQSGSMTEDFGGSNRWDELYSALMDPIDGVVIRLEDQVRFGLALYTGDGGAQCPQLIQQAIALGNHAAIDAVYAPEGPLGDTPTGDSIDAVLPPLIAFAEEGPKFIILATDGEPDTCEQPNPQQGQGESITATQNAFAAGVGLFVISVGGDVSDAHLQDVANAGAGLPLDTPNDAPFWKALDPAGLVTAFDTIINGVRSCVLTVDGEINPETACEGEVRIDGNVIPCNDPDGWVLNSPTEIELQGAACDLIQSGLHTVDATFPCDAAETSGTGTGGESSTSSIPN